jgi:hypothetical protein
MCIAHGLLLLYGRKIRVTKKGDIFVAKTAGKAGHLLKAQIFIEPKVFFDLLVIGSKGH